MEIKEMKCEHNFKLNKANGHVVCLKCGDVYIPISKIDAKIKELRETPDQFGSSIYYYHSEVIKRVCEELEDLKKE